MKLWVPSGEKGGACAGMCKNHIVCYMSSEFTLLPASFHFLFLSFCIPSNIPGPWTKLHPPLLCLWLLSQPTFSMAAHPYFGPRELLFFHPGFSTASVSLWGRLPKLPFCRGHTSHAFLTLVLHSSIQVKFNTGKTYPWWASQQVCPAGKLTTGQQSNSV